MKKPTSNIRCVAQLIDFIDYKKSLDSSYTFDLSDIKLDRIDFMNFLARQIVKDGIEDLTVAQILAALYHQNISYQSFKTPSFKSNLKNNTEKLLVNLYKIFKFSAIEKGRLDVASIDGLEKRDGSINILELVHYFTMKLEGVKELSGMSLRGAL